MKAILEFNLPAEVSEYEVAFYGWKWKAILANVDFELRRMLKHGHSFATIDDVLDYFICAIASKMADEEVSF